MTYEEEHLLSKSPTGIKLAPKPYTPKSLPTQAVGSLIVKLIYWSKTDATNIDRRTCKRVVPMKVLVLGCSRTATSSIQAALQDLGYNSTYHAGQVYKDNPRDADMWVEAYRAKFHGEGTPFGKEEFDMLLGHCMAVTDVPCLHFKEELVAAYPDAKIVLSMRDTPEAWLKSVQKTLVPFAERTAAGSLVNRIKKFFMPRLPFQTMNEEMMQGDPASFERTEFYTGWNDDVRQLARERDERFVRDGQPERATGLLEFNVKSGWRPLCEYLGVPVPRDENGEEMPFPRLNDAADFNKNVSMVTGFLDVLVVVNMVCSGVGLWAVYKVLLWGLGKSG